jgi:molybdopterin-guanine dinucleotide biosynthesis protein A
MSKRSLLILAAGRSSRMESTIPKALSLINGRSSIELIVSQLHSVFDEVTVVCSEANLMEIRSHLEPLFPNLDLTYKIQKNLDGTFSGVRDGFDLDASTTVLIWCDQPMFKLSIVSDLIKFFEDSLTDFLLPISKRKENYTQVIFDTNGKIEKILQAYKNTIGNTNKTITDGHNIIWDHFFIFIKWLATNEDVFFKEEYKLRNRREKSFSNIKEEWKKIELLPNYDREIEKFINPEEEGWQSRYYQTLFSEKKISTIVDNYLEGLLWNVKYYSEGCIDWTWKYNYHYPPLLCDLLKYGKQSVKKIQFNSNTTAVNELTQLCYVVPNSSLHIIPNQIKKRLMKYSHLYPNDCVFMWAFCKYFWESHVMLPEIDISFIEKLVS